MDRKCDFCGEPAEFVYDGGGGYEDMVAVCYKHDRAIRVISSEDIVKYLKDCFSDAIKEFFTSVYGKKKLTVKKEIAK